MKKIGILTDYGYQNFGNRLQNFATIEFFSELGFAAYNIIPNKKISFASKIKSSIAKAKNSLFASSEYLRKKAIFEACSKYEHSLKCVKKNKKHLELFDFYVFGSDQIWNYQYHEKDLSFFLGEDLSRIVSNPTYISLAASFGFPVLPSCKKEYYRINLSKFSNISVREQSGTQIISELGLKHATLACDPTLLFNRESWDSFILDYSSIEKITGNYVVSYFLDNSIKEKTPELLQLIEPFENINLLDKNSKYYVCNHFDFVKFIKYAEYVLTDSYHAFIFSLIYGKKVVLYLRDDYKEMSERFESLLKLLGITYNFKTHEVIDLSSVNKNRINDLIDLTKQFLKESIKNEKS